MGRDEGLGEGWVGGGRGGKDVYIGYKQGVLETAIVNDES